MFRAVFWAIFCAILRGSSCSILGCHCRISSGRGFRINFEFSFCSIPESSETIPKSLVSVYDHLKFAASGGAQC